MNLEGKRAKFFYSDGTGVQVRFGTVSEVMPDYFVLEHSVLLLRAAVFRVELTE